MFPIHKPPLGMAVWVVAVWQYIRVHFKKKSSPIAEAQKPPPKTPIHFKILPEESCVLLKNIGNPISLQEHA